MDRRELLAATGALTAVALAGCIQNSDSDDEDPGTDDEEPSTDPEKNPEIPEDELQALARDNAAFATNLYRELRTDTDENVFFSPYSISVALAMVYAGAEGETATEMEETLQFTAGEDVHPAFASLQHELTDREEIEDPEADDEDDTVDAFKLRVANALWGQEGTEFAADYLTLTEEYYGAGIADADFAGDSDGERERINDWVADQTEDRIDDLLPEGSITAETVLVLTNAIYFLASWQSEFDPDDTEEGPFETLEGSESTAQFMSQSLRTGYADVDGAEAVELRYVGGEVSMVLVLPEDGNFEEFESDFDADRLFDIFDDLSDYRGELFLPKFEVETEFQLSEPLQELGMTRSFGGDADFGGMYEGDGTGSWIDEVYHDAFVSVDEEGTEAAAATAVTMPVDEPSSWGELRFDRPFLFCIRDRPTDSVLFLGRVTDPA